MVLLLDFFIKTAKRACSGDTYRLDTETEGST